MLTFPAVGGLSGYVKMECVATIIEPVPHLMDDASSSVICVESGPLHNWLLANQSIVISDTGHKQPTGS